MTSLLVHIEAGLPSAADPEANILMQDDPREMREPGKGRLFKDSFINTFLLCATGDITVVLEARNSE